MKHLWKKGLALLCVIAMFVTVIPPMEAAAATEVASGGSNTDLEELSAIFYGEAIFYDWPESFPPDSYQVEVDLQAAQTNAGADVYIPCWYDENEGIYLSYYASQEDINIEGIKDKYLVGDAAEFYVTPANGEEYVTQQKYKINFKTAPNADQAELENLYVLYNVENYDDSEQKIIDLSRAASSYGARVSLPENVDRSYICLFGDIKNWGRYNIDDFPHYGYGGVSGKFGRVMIKAFGDESTETVSEIEFDVLSADDKHWKTYKVTLIIGEDTEAPLIKDINDCTVSNIPAQTYTGKALTPFVAVKDGDKTLVKGTDFTATYKNNINAGTATATITGKGNYTGTVTKTFTINKAKLTKASLSATSYTFNGKAKKPSVTVKAGSLTAASKITKDSSRIDLTYASGRKNIGTYKVTIKGKGNYTGTITKSFKINPKGVSVSSLSKSKKAFTVKWKKSSSTYRKQMTGYQIRYSTSSKMTKAKTVTVKSTKATSKKISKLKAKKKYYVQIRTYKTVKGKKYYSGWSKAKSVKTR